jgi:anti-sigma B factor antagonist
MQITTSVNAPEAMISVDGDVDMATVGALENAIEAALVRTDITHVLVDLAGVTFLDSSGISGLLKGRRHADAHGKTYRIASATGVALRVLEVSGVWDHLAGGPTAGGGS